MEDVLEVYSRAPQPDRPRVCLDEFAKQLLSETRAAVAAIPGHLAREDYEYVREGSVSGFMIAMPHLGKRDVFVGGDGRRTALDFAACLDHLRTLCCQTLGKLCESWITSTPTRKPRFTKPSRPKRHAP